MEKINYSGLIPFDFKGKGEQKFKKIQEELFNMGIKWNSFSEKNWFLTIDNDTKKIKSIIIKMVMNRDVLFYSTSDKPEHDDNEKYMRIQPNKIKEGYDKLNKLRLVEKL